MNKKTITVEEHKNIIKNILTAHERQLERLYDDLEIELDKKVKVIDKLKYVQWNPFRFLLRKKRSETIITFRQIKAKFEKYL